jgi:hypothetical protein
MMSRKVAHPEVGVDDVQPEPDWQVAADVVDARIGWVAVDRDLEVRDPVAVHALGLDELGQRNPVGFDLRRGSR